MEKVFSFRDENGNLVRYKVKEHVEVGNKEYVVMCSEDNDINYEVFRFESEDLEFVEDSEELAKVKAASKVL
ncbi:MAG: DUF1292 domain-containing protein [Clostridium sp.]|uniref:DUF1292 domain-containing protein n=1 Tax=Clostridium sp. TaxID=1506 RepID=UPI002A8854F8|nr:DUF1292 domain-containing protein [Clostridium sp.]MDY5096944.1 DUF1292 domain-containing protein [Clostridium sp.]